MSHQRPPSISPEAAQRWQSLPVTQSPWLHEEVARRMEERLAWIKLQPSAWAHWSPLKGGLQAHELLTRRYPAAACHVVEADEIQAKSARKMLEKPWWAPARWTGAAMEFSPPADGAVQMLWANMSLHMSADPLSLMAQWHRAVAVDGFVMFSCLGPDTLRELRALYLAMGWPAPTHDFTDMHDWGDMLVAAGFAEPVMDMERITLSFDSPERLLQELRGLGRNLNADRFSGLRGRAWHAQLLKAMDSPLQLTFEVIYGHAFKPTPRLPMQAQTEVSLAQMRETLHQRKSYPRPA
ncbi:class I SAM-dependent methyltransferase [Rhodoferax sp. PAMC 29310]|uniref:class I SAM-dependent methyltransferase n=1 Tax=Rhodoferax sp. PAMC 29310 TaxID=2822760 RepID=UPI001B32557A|nr:biotin synthase [Rhodoferax sp. PAMC 29310]